MESLADRWASIWHMLTKSATRSQSRIIIPHSQVGDGRSAEAFRPDEHYFQVRINEMYLAYSREWVKTYDPMVSIVSEFLYNAKREAVPFIVGPSMLEKYKLPAPDGMVFENTRVAGLHPYKGGSIALSVMLYKVSQKDYAKRLLQILEHTVGALDFSNVLSTYLKIAGVALDGIETLFGLEQTVPVIGWRIEIDPDANDRLEPCYFALIDKPESQIDPQKLWVRDKRLRKGESKEKNEPFREADYVLYSLVQTPARSDVTGMPFYKLYEEIIEDARVPTKKSMKSAESKLFTLSQDMLINPDMTRSHAKSLWREYEREMREEHKARVASSPQGEGEEKVVIDADLERELQETFKILKS
jgi:hypothetical protein